MHRLKHHLRNISNNCISGSEVMKIFDKLENTKLFSKVVEPMNNPGSNGWIILTEPRVDFLIFAKWGCKIVSQSILIFIFLITMEKEYIFAFICVIFLPPPCEISVCYFCLVSTEVFSLYPVELQEFFLCPESYYFTYYLCGKYILINRCSSFVM